MNKKAQAQIITTVLIILLVLAAIVIVWQVVSGTIEKGGEQIETQSGCIGVTMEVTKAVAGQSTVIVRRGQGDSNIKVTGCKVFIDGEKVGECAQGVEIPPLDTPTVNIFPAPTEGQAVSVAAIVGNTVCAPSSEFKATAS